MKRFFLCAWMLGAAVQITFAQPTVSVTTHVVASSDILDNTLISSKINLKNNATPIVTLQNIKTKPIAQLPENAKASNSFDPDIIVGMERKKPVGFVNIPAYRLQNGQLEMLVSYDLSVTEQQTPPSNTAQRPTVVANSILSSGTWYKIAVPNRGIFKIDYNFLQTIGANPGSINPANIRVYGNGGTVLPEKPNSNQPDDLIENAVVVNASGSSFGTTDYVLFYANGPVLWEKDSVKQRFKHTNNYYENYSYYFLNFDLGPGKRIQQEAATGTATHNVTSFNDYQVTDLDSVNVGNIGKVFWSHRMTSVYAPSLTQSLDYNLGNPVGLVHLEANVGNRSGNGGHVLKLTASPQTSPATNLDFSLGSQGDGHIFQDVDTINFTPTSGNINVQLRYFPNGEGVAYLDYLRFNYKRSLSFNTGQLNFRDWSSAGLGAGENAAFKIQTSNSNIKVWEITNPLEPISLNGTASGSEYTVVREGNRLREFIAYDGSQFFTPVALNPSVVANQDLHSLGHTDFLIITRNDLLPAAEELANYHRNHDNMHVTVATVDKIYNEFSSGGQDIGGIRNFVKMFYDRADSDEEMVKNVLFFGAASFDYKDRIANNTNMVPTFETYNSYFYSGPYSSDDFYGLLDDGNDELLDVGIGRIPAYNLTEANEAVAKIKNYTSANSFGPWKNTVTYIADDKDKIDRGSMNHLDDCEQVNKFFSDSANIYNTYKIYSDAHQVVEASAGARYPTVNKSLNNQIFNGTFMLSYSGHGGPQRWADEAILTQEDYNSWSNINKLPVMVTATCDFGRFDDPTNRSAGAKLMMSPKGGSIAMVTTTQVVYASQNTALNRSYVRKQFLADANGDYKTLGEALSAAKNAFPAGGENNRKYVVLGDPALKMQMPVHKVRTSKLYLEDDNDVTETDTIRALGRYLLNGEITDKNDNILADFNGDIYVSIFDKTKNVQTNNQRSGVSNVTPSFNLQTNVIAKIKGTVTNGEFSVNFIAPKDINYEYGFGKISYYANSDVTDAAGLDVTYTVGGYNPNAVEDNEGPVVKPYIDNAQFRDGGVVSPNPLLHVKLFDENGINVSGNSIGHDLVAILDGDVANPYILNDFYQTEANDYKNGFVNFPMYNLPDGVHTIRVRAWDVYNNSGEGVVTFEVKNKDNGFISELYNYPNPVTDVTHFVFQHNQKEEKMDVTIQIYTSNGRMVKTIKEIIVPEGNRTEITWNGTGEKGEDLSKGVYFYKIYINTEKGKSATAYQKLVMLR